MGCLLSCASAFTAKKTPIKSRRRYWFLETLLIKSWVWSLSSDKYLPPLSTKKFKLNLAISDPSVFQSCDWHQNSYCQ